MDDFRIDANRWRFLNYPARYIGEDTNSGLKVEPLARQFRTAKEILARFAKGHGVLLADDVGLGKTTVGALVAWVFACQGKRVRIYAPNEVLRRRWAEELKRHVKMLQTLEPSVSEDLIKQGDVARLNPGRIQIATHHSLVMSHRNKQLRPCDLIIIDEAHRAKGDGSAFNDALREHGDQGKRKLILTATPFSVRLAELEQLLQFVGATDLKAVRLYAGELKRLYSLGVGRDVAHESKRLVSAAAEAIDELQPYLIRHGIDDLSLEERKHFGRVARGGEWDIPTAPATKDDLALLLRMDRLLQLAPERRGERRNDPRFHIGWQHVSAELERAADRASDPVARRHIQAAKSLLNKTRTKPHPKIAAVSDAIRPILENGEKVLVFCHHRATASELLGELERSLKAVSVSRCGPSEKVWRATWESLLLGEDALFSEDYSLVKQIINWLCTPGLRAQISGWLGEPALTVEELAKQLKRTRPRGSKLSVPTVYDSANRLMAVLLDRQSTSTRALLKSIAKGTQTFGGKASHFPGRLDDGFRVMGSWHHDGQTTPPRTLYTGKPDIVLALFNSPFGPDVLVTTDRLSEGVDLHRYCRHLIHYELDPSPVRTLQRNGRVRRVGSWAALTGRPIQYGYPTFEGTRDKKAFEVMKQRINAFDLLLGGVPSLDNDTSHIEQSFVDNVLRLSKGKLKSLNGKLAVQH